MLTSTAVVLDGDLRSCLLRMLFSNRGCAQGERAGCQRKLLQVADGLSKGSFCLSYLRNFIHPSKHSAKANAQELFTIDTLPRIEFQLI